MPVSESSPEVSKDKCSFFSDPRCGTWGQGRVHVSERFQRVRKALARTSDKDYFSYRSFAVLKQLSVGQRSHNDVEQEKVRGGFG